MLTFGRAILELQPVKIMTAEKLTKSKERISKYGEVYTPKWIVNRMLDMLEPNGCFDDISKTFLEPACGNGNFLAEIFERKLKLCKNPQAGLKALASIYGIDILPDNVEESRQRLFDMFIEKYPKCSLRDIMFAEMILRQNIICGNSLEIMKKWEEEKNVK